jgi:tol-pal system protein YbgF
MDKENNINIKTGLLSPQRSLGCRYAPRNDVLSIFFIATLAGSREKHSMKNNVKMAAVLFTSLLLTTSLHAQENPALVVDLINRVGAVEAENRELRGQLEEARHELTSLTRQMETLSADVDYRLNNPESGAHAPPSNSSASLTSSSSTPPSLGKEASSSSGTAAAEYERARSLLEQGDYAAAEHAFSAFLATYGTDELAGAAQYWLGVTFFVRGDHEKAASTFAKGYKTYPKSSKAPDNLLKLSKSLAALDRKADACTALEQLTSEHPKSHVTEVASERKKLECK